MQTVTDRYGRKTANTEIIPDVLDRYGRAVVEAKPAAEPKAPVEIVQDELEDIEVAEL